MCLGVYLSTTVCVLANKQIQDLKVYCDNHGCVWTGTVGNFEKHEAQCGYAKVPCPNDCSKQLLRKYLDKHLHCECVKRKCSCDHCGMEGTYTSLHDHDCKINNNVITF